MPKSQRRQGCGSGFKGQVGIEYNVVFGLGVLLLILAITTLTLFVLNHTTAPPTISTCYLSVQLNCYQIGISNNGGNSIATLEFTNDLGVPLSFPQNAFTIYPTSTPQKYVGSCIPINAVAGSAIMCSAVLPGYAPTISSPLEPRFQISYLQCAYNQCTLFNTSGSGSLYVLPKVSTFNVQLVSLLPNGKIAINGVQYPSGTTLSFIGGQTYSITATVPAGQSFAGWLVSGGARVQSASQASTTAWATSNGVIKAQAG